MVRHSAMEVTMLRGVEFVERKNTDAFSLSPASVPLCSILSPTAIVLWSDTMKIQKCFMQMIETKQEWFGQHFEVFSWIWGALWLGILNEFVTTRRVTVCKWKDWSLNCIKKSQWFWKDCVCALQKKYGWSHPPPQNLALKKAENCARTNHFLNERKGFLHDNGLPLQK